MNKKNKYKNFIFIIIVCFGIVVVLFGCRPAGQTSGSPTASKIVLVILGNEPLDQETPTVDMVARVTKAVEFTKEHPGALCIFTGGQTVGSISEARMMANMAMSQGILPEGILLEEQARTTSENARLTAEMIRRINPQRILIVTKNDHIDWAMPIFKEIDIFKLAEPLSCEVDRAESIAQMEEYLKTHENPRVYNRLQKLKTGIRGID